MGVERWDCINSAILVVTLLKDVNACLAVSGNMNLRLRWRQERGSQWLWFAVTLSNTRTIHGAETLCLENVIPCFPVLHLEELTAKSYLPRPPERAHRAGRCCFGRLATKKSSGYTDKFSESCVTSCKNSWKGWFSLKSSKSTLVNRDKNWSPLFLVSQSPLPEADGKLYLIYATEDAKTRQRGGVLYFSGHPFIGNGVFVYCFWPSYGCQRALDLKSIWMGRAGGMARNTWCPVRKFSQILPCPLCSFQIRTTRPTKDWSLVAPIWRVAFLRTVGIGPMCHGMVTLVKSNLLRSFRAGALEYWVVIGTKTSY